MYAWQWQVQDERWPQVLVSSGRAKATDMVADHTQLPKFLKHLQYSVRQSRQ
jgi:hypothetical protein